MLGYVDERREERGMVKARGEDREGERERELTHVRVCVCSDYQCPYMAAVPP